MIQVEEIRARVLEELDMTKEVEDEELQKVIHRILEETSRETYISLQQKASIGREIFNALRKLDILQELLEDEEITEIMINGPEHIFIEREGALLQLERQFSSRSKLEDIIQQIVAGSNRIVNEATPIVDARLADGSRVNIVLQPIALDGPIVTIRKFPREAMTMTELVLRKTLDEEMAEFLEVLVKSKYNIFLSGGTGSG